MVIVMILLYSWIGGNGFSTLMMPKLQRERSQYTTALVTRGSFSLVRYFTILGFSDGRIVALPQHASPECSNADTWDYKD
jgi:hypothetical protein